MHKCRNSKGKQIYFVNVPTRKWLLFSPVCRLYNQSLQRISSKRKAYPLKYQPTSVLLLFPIEKQTKTFVSHASASIPLKRRKNGGICLNVHFLKSRQNVNERTRLLHLMLLNAYLQLSGGQHIWQRYGNGNFIGIDHFMTSFLLLFFPLFSHCRKLSKLRQTASVVVNVWYSTTTITTTMKITTTTKITFHFNTILCNLT